MSTKPTHEQAQLHLQVYDLRREAKLREARDWCFQNLYVDTMQDWMRLAGPGTPNGAKVMMTLTYWDQACALLNHGLLHEDLFFETTGEFFGIWERIKHLVPEGREMFKNKLFLAHTEKAAKRFEEWMDARSPGAITAMRGMMQQMRPKAGATA